MMPVRAQSPSRRCVRCLIKPPRACARRPPPGGEFGHIGRTLASLEQVRLEVHDAKGWREHDARMCRLWTERRAARPLRVRRGTARNPPPRAASPMDRRPQTEPEAAPPHRRNPPDPTSPPPSPRTSAKHPKPSQRPRLFEAAACLRGSNSQNSLRRESRSSRRQHSSRNSPRGWPMPRPGPRCRCGGRCRARRRVRSGSGPGRCWR